MSMTRILGLDFGTRRVGVAVSDPRHLLATPVEVYHRRDLTQDARHFRQIVADNDVDRIVVGLPLHTGGGEGDLAKAARAWGTWIAGITGLPVSYYDERYTSVEAEETLRAAGLKAKKRQELRDMLAARILLQNYLDAGCPLDEATATSLMDQPIPDEG
ncbi:Holliday junction resolvase RuvX [Isosphaeraceae bacterium EP7]